MRTALIYGLFIFSILPSGCGLDPDIDHVSNSVAPVSTQNNTPQELEPEVAPVPSPLPDRNYFHSERPEKIAGKEGYTFLKNEYFRQYCGRQCHSSTGFANPPFADDNDEVAYQSATLLSWDDMRPTIEDNSFCYDCNLEAIGDVYKGIMEWFSAKF